MKYQHYYPRTADVDRGLKFQRNNKRTVGDVFSKTYPYLFLLLFSSIMESSRAQNSFFQNGVLTTSTNYTSGIPTNTSDVLLTTPTNTLDLSTANLAMRSLSINNGQVYNIIYNTNSASNFSLTLGNNTSFTNPISGLNNDLLYIGSGTLTFGGGNTAGGTGVANLVLASSGNFNVHTGATLVIGSATGGAISGAFGLTKTGNGTLTLNGNNSYSGPTLLNAGTLALGNPSALSTGSFTLGTGTSFDNTSGAAMTLTTNNTFSFPSTSTFIGSNNLNIGTAPVALSQVTSIGTNANILTIPAVVSGAYGITKTGAGTLELTGNNTYTGGSSILAGSLTLSGTNTTTGNTTLSGGGLNIKNAYALGSGPINITANSNINNTSTSALTLAYNNTQNWGGDFTFTGTQDLNMGTGAITLAGNRTLTTTAGTLTLGGAIGGAYKLTKAGLGSLVLNGVNTYTGGTVLTGGSLLLGSASAISAGLITITGGTLDNVSGGTIILTNTTDSWGGNYTFTGTNNLNLGNGSLALTANSTVTITDSGKSLTVGGVVNGAYSLSKSGKGILYLNNNNIFTGGTNLQQGVLNLGHPSAVGTGAFNINTSTFDNTSGSSMTLTNNNPIVMAGVINFMGSNNLNLGINTTTLNAATTVNVVSGTLTLGGQVKGAFGLNKSGPGTLTLNGINTFTGGTTLNGGAINIGNASAFGTGGITIASPATIDNVTGVSLVNSQNNTQTWNDSLTFIGTKSYNMGTGNIVLGNPQSITVNANTLTLGGNISGAYPLTMAGAGALTLAGSNNTFSGGTVLSSGSLNLNSASALGTGTFTVSGGKFDNTSSSTIINSNNNAQSWLANPVFEGTKSYNLGTGTVAMSASRIVTVQASTLTVGGPITGSAFSLSKAGTGTLILNGANTYTGGTNVSAGTLTLAGASTTTGSTTLSNGATLNINNDSTLGTGGLTLLGGRLDNTSGSMVTNVHNTTQSWDGDFTFTGSNSLNLGTGAVTLSANRVVTVRSNTLVVGGSIGGGYLLTKAGNGSLALTATNTYSGGTNITAGTLELSGANTFSGLINVSSSGTLAVNSVSCLGNSPLTMSGGYLDNLSGGAITLSNPTPQTWAGDFTFLGTDNLNMGTGGITLASDRTITISDNTLTLDGGIVGGANGLTLEGPGTLILNAANTYTGATIINSGILIINNTHSSSTTINTGGILTGTGTINNDVTINSGGYLLGTGASSGIVTVNGTISPGVAGTQGTYTATGNMVWNNGGTYNCDLTGVASTNCDKLAISGSLTTPTSGVFTIALFGTIPGFNSGTASTWTIGSYNGGTPTNTHILIDSSGITNPNFGTFSLSFASNTITLNYAPEVDAPPFATSTSIVYNGLPNAIIAVSAPNCTIDWYTNPTGGTSILSSNDTTPTNIAAGVYTYYGESRDTTTGVISSTRTKVVLTITQAATTITGILGAPKTYDGNTSASVTGSPVYSGLVNGETFGVTGSPVFDFYPSKHVGIGLTITVSGYNAPSSNYYLNEPMDIIGDITPYPITLTATTDTKIYDGTFSSTSIPIISLGSVQGTDSANFAEVYNTDQAGTNLTLVSNGKVIDGNNGNDYSYTFLNDTTGVINPATLTVTADSKSVFFPYAPPPLTYTITGMVNGELVGLVTSGVPTLSTAYIGSTPFVSSFPIFISMGSLISNGDYIFNYVNGTLLVDSCSVGTWLGSTSTDASVPSNWCKATLPDSTINVLIPNGNIPIVTSITSVKNINIFPSAGILVNGTLQIASTVTNDGSLNAHGGTIELNGTTAQNISSGNFDNDSLGTLVINNLAGVTLYTDLGINGFLHIKSGSLDLANNNITLLSNISATAQVGTVNGDITYSGFGRFVAERYINNQRRGYRNISSSGLLSDSNIFANWQEDGAYIAGLGTQITGERGWPVSYDPITGADYTYTGNPSMWTYNTADAFVPITNTMAPSTNALIPFVGYYILIRGDRTYDLTSYTPILTIAKTTLRTKGKILTGQVTLSSNNDPVWAYSANAASSFRLNKNVVPPGKMISDYGFSLVGNPYACTIDWNSVYTRSTALCSNRLSKYYWIWNQSINGNVGGWVTVDNTGIANVNAATTATTNNNYVQPGQSFFIVNDHSGGDIVLDMEETDKYVTDNTKINTTFSTFNNPNLIRLGLKMKTISDTVLTDGAVVEMDASYNNAIDINDAPKFTNTTENISIFRSNQNISIENRKLPDLNDSIPLHIWNVSIDSTYLLNIDATALSTSFQPYLYDRMLGTMQPVSTSTINNISFTPTIDSNTYQNRFSLVFGKNVILPISFLSLTVAPENGQNHIEWAVLDEGQTFQYNIERSTNGKTFNQIGELSANIEKGKSSYSFYDATPIDGDNYYRIVATGGSASRTSNVVKVDAGLIGSIKIYPTYITDNHCSLHLQKFPKGNYDWRLYDLKGALLYQQTLVHNGGNGVYDVNLSINKLPLGVYDLVVYSGNTRLATQKLTVY